MSEQESINACKTHHQREDFVAHIQQNLPNSDVISALSELFKSWEILPECAFCGH